MAAPDVGPAPDQPPGNWDRTPPRTRGPRSVERAQEVFRLRKDEGLSFKEIGRRIGVSHTTASKLFRAYVGQIQRETTDLAREMVTLEMQRLDDLYALNYAIASNPANDPEEVARASAVCTRVIGVQAKVLGIEAAQTIELSGPNGGPIKVEHHFAELDDEELDKRLDAFMDPGYMQGAADAFAVAEKLAAEGKLLPPDLPVEDDTAGKVKSKRKRNKQVDEAAPANHVVTPGVPPPLPPISAGRARV